MANEFIGNEQQFYYVCSDETIKRLNSVDEVMKYLIEKIGYSPEEFKNIESGNQISLFDTFVVIKGKALDVRPSFTIK